ncbi:MAG: arginase [Pseudomonadales bacterium]|jgi:arginase|nr:arginase [Pseudomonadales bacterium]
MNVSISNVHLDLGAGRRGTDMGPSAIHVAGLVPALERLGHSVDQVVSFDPESAEGANEHQQGETSARFLPVIAKLCARIADKVEADCEAGRFPLVLGGDHAQAIGTISGLARFYRKRGERIGVVWVDAHTDMNTPDSSPSGNIHGMPLAALLGHGPESLTSLAGDGPALRAEDVAVIGARDIDPTEAPLVRETGIRVYTMSELDRRGTSACVAEAFERVSRETVGVHLSFDLDGVDPDDAPGTGTPVPGGLNLRESHLICETAAESGKLLGMELVELNPTLDYANKTGRLGVWLIESALGRKIL